MTREETQERIGVMQHFADGGEVEFLSIPSKVWTKTTDPIWGNIKYRIKPDTKSEDLLNRFFGDLKSILDDPKVDSSNLFEHLGKTLKP